MNEFQLFENPSFGSIRVIERDGKTWFVAKDIAEILGYSDSYAMTKRLPEKYKQKIKTDDLAVNSNSFGTNVLLTINESGFYKAIMGSQKENAEAFQDWVLEEVLPTIRKYGMYATPKTLEAMIADPAVAIGLLQELQKEQEARKRAEIEALEAIRTKAHISDKKTATSMTTASSAVRRANKIAKENEELKSNVNKLKLAQGAHREYATTVKVAQALKMRQEFPWPPLKLYCIEKDLWTSKFISG